MVEVWTSVYAEAAGVRGGQGQPQIVSFSGCSLEPVDNRSLLLPITHMCVVYILRYTKHSLSKAEESPASGKADGISKSLPKLVIVSQPLIRHTHRSLPAHVPEHMEPYLWAHRFVKSLVGVMQTYHQSDGQTD